LWRGLLHIHQWDGRTALFLQPAKHACENIILEKRTRKVSYDEIREQLFARTSETHLIFNSLSTLRQPLEPESFNDPLSPVAAITIRHRT
jgi:hypothetical protein